MTTTTFHAHLGWRAAALKYDTSEYARRASLHLSFRDRLPPPHKEYEWASCASYLAMSDLREEIHKRVEATRNLRQDVLYDGSLSLLHERLSRLLLTATAAGHLWAAWVVSHTRSLLVVGAWPALRVFMASTGMVLRAYEGPPPCHPHATPQHTTPLPDEERAS